MRAHQPSADRACAPSGLSRSSASQAKPLVPCAETCPTCVGKGYWKVGDSELYRCYRCEAPDDETVEFALARLTGAQKRRILFNEPTLAYQHVSPDDWDAILVPATCYVERDDALIDDGEVIIPATMVWFGGGSAHYYGDGKDWHFDCYLNGLGVTLRERLLALAAGARSDETPKVAQSEGRQSGPKGNAQ